MPILPAPGHLKYRRGTACASSCGETLNDLHAPHHRSLWGLGVTVSDPQPLPSGTGVGSVTVLIVDDHPVLRHGLASMLAVESWTAQITQAGTVSEGARLA